MAHDGMGTGLMFVCEYEFEKADPETPMYSLAEVDFFTDRRFRLSIRKNLTDGRFEAYLHQHDGGRDFVIDGLNA